MAPAQVGVVLPSRSRPHFGLWALLYAVVVFYASTGVTAVGFVMHPRDPEEMFWKLLNVPLVTHGSDQRADWMGNLWMLIPLGFLVAASLLPAPRPAGRRWGRGGPLYGGIARRVLAAIVAFMLCLAYIAGVKYAQLFTQRTVTLNYIIAQTAGAGCGILLSVCAIDAITARVRRIRDGTHDGLISLLQLYTGAVFLFALAPFDIVLSAEDMAERLASLPSSLLSVPGAERAWHLRVLINLGAMGMMVPVGMLLRAIRPARSLLPAALLLVGAMMALSMLILSAAPSLLSVPLRLAGIMAGGVVYEMLGRWDIRPWRRALPYVAGLAVLPYLVALLAANSLITFHWRTPMEAWAALEPRLLLPLWTHYIVPKAQAIKSVVVHVLMFMPVGAIIWAWFGSGRWQIWLAAALGGLLALAVEVGRAMVPGLAPDVNNIAIGAAAAGAMVGLMRILWAMLESVRAKADG